MGAKETDVKLSILLWVARALALAWAGFWLWFGIAYGIGEGLDPVGALIHAAFPGGLAMVAALVAWWKPVAGGWLLIAEGSALVALMGSAVNILTGGFLALTLVLPPLASGILFLLAGRTGGAPSPG